MTDEQLTQRIRAASDAIALSDDAQARHLEAISSALSDGDVVPLSGARSTRRRQVIASIVAAAMIAPAGLAAASDGAVPGDALYGVKQASERVLVLFDSDVIARHRIEEIEALERDGRVDPDLYEDARVALTELDENHPLWERLSTTTANDEDETASMVREDDDRSDAVTGVTANLDLPDGSQATITIESGRIVDITTPPGWEIGELDDDEATLTSPAHRVEIDLASDGTLRTEIVAQVHDDAASSDDDPDGDESDANDDDEIDSTSSDDSREEDGDESHADAEDDEDPERDPEDDDASG